MQIEITPENRTKYLLQAFGWQGGTIHQLAEETGCEVSDLLYSKIREPLGITTDFFKGWSAARTCELQWNLDVNFPPRKGNLQFWQGVMRGLQLVDSGI